MKKTSLPLLAVALVFNTFAMLPAISSPHNKPILSKPQVFGSSHKWAVVIGVGEFQNSEWNIKYGRKDAVDFRNYLVGRADFAPNHVRLLLDHDATTDNITQALAWLGKVAAYNDLAVIYIRTRGALADQSNKTRDYLAKNDKAPEWASAYTCNSRGGCVVTSHIVKGRDFLASYDTNPDQVEAHGIEMATLVDALVDQIRPGALVIVADADFSGTLWRGAAPASRLMFRLRKGNPFVLVCSTDDKEIAWESDVFENSIFTHELLQALVNDPSAAFLKKVSSTRVQVQNDVTAIKANRSQDVLTMGINSGRGPTDVILGPECASQKSGSQDGSQDTKKMRPLKH